MKFSGKVYEILKWTCLICLPAITTFWLTLAGIWSLPYGEAIGATMNALATFIGALIGISTKTYRKELDCKSPDDVVE
jgi:hypothetical protein